MPINIADLLEKHLVATVYSVPQPHFHDNGSL